MSIDEAVLSHAITSERGFADLQRAGITAEHFIDDEYEAVWNFLTKMRRKHGKTPSKSVVRTRFPDIRIVKVRERDVPMLYSELQNRKKYRDFLDLIDEASRLANDPEDTEAVVAGLMSGLNGLSIRNGDSPLVDLFSKETTDRLHKDIRHRRKAVSQGIPTGLRRFDAVTGGLQKSRMIVLIGRTGRGKSWLNLLFVASAVRYGAKVGLYPLEMTLEDTAYRLFSIFSCQMFGANKAIKNLDMTMGHVSMKKVAKLTSLLEDKYAGQLWVADMGNLSDPYTMDRVGAEQDIYDFDMQWIDYLTLMKAPGVGRQGQEDYTTIKALSSGAKSVATRGRHVVGVSAQVNREALRGKSFLPRLENIAYGDSIGHDADQVVAVNRKDEDDPDLYYGLVKNRHGPETGKIRVKFAVNEGNIRERDKQEGE